MPQPWTLVLPEPLHRQLIDHLFPGEGDEHGAVLAAGIATSGRGTRLLARDLFLAQDGVDFVPGVRGYRRLTAEFVSSHIRYCRDAGLAYLAIHNHGGNDEVEFSPTDNKSHERGYPALLDIAGRPVGALVFAENAVAGDLWTPDRARRELDHAVIIGRNVRHLYATPPPVPPTADAMYDRQVRWLGDRGQDRLRRLKVGVIGAGGVGLPLITMLARLGVGWISVVDPDRVEVSNLPRLDVRTSDAMLHLRKLPVLSRFADRLSAHKVRVARRTARRANPNIRFDAIALNVADPDAASHLVDCDFVFLAADSHQARMVFNALTHQYLIPGIQMGTRIDTVRESGAVADIRSNVRLIIPGNDGCLRCNQLISAAKLQQESLGDRERERNRYVDEVPAPSVITFNTAVAAQAASDFLLMMGGLIHDAAHLDYLRFRPRIRTMERVVALAAQSTCRDCSVDPRSRRGRGDSVLLPLPERPK